MFIMVQQRTTKSLFHQRFSPLRLCPRIIYSSVPRRCGRFERVSFTKRSEQCDFTSVHRNAHIQSRIISTGTQLKLQHVETGPHAIYRPPQAGLLSFLPPSWVPYAELIRLDNPTGTYYLFFPCLFSTLLAAPLASPVTGLTKVLGTSVLFFSGALIMRGAGCTINDLWDRNLDPRVERTRLRPIARKAITARSAIVFLGFQLLAGLGILLQFPHQCLYYAVPSLLLVAIYPLAKRVTNYPQFVLGLTFSWGAFMGFPALGIDLATNSTALAAAAALYSSCIAWTVNYDMIYAHMDIKDDVNAGIKSIARAHQHNTRAVLSGLTITQISLLALSGYVSGAGPSFYLVSCVGAGVSLASMIRLVRLEDPRDCWWWFVNGCWITGGTISAGLFADYLFRKQENTKRSPIISAAS